VDHRARVGRERCDRTHGQILAAAVEVFARKGPDAPVIEDFIRAAGVARGTFYNYYRSTEELLQAASRRLEDELILAIEMEMSALTDPVQRLTMGIRLWMKKARSDPEWCSFTVRNRRHGALVERQLTRDLRAGLRAGAFSFQDVQVARDLVVGTIREAMGRMMDGGSSATHIDDVAAMILRALGLREHTITRALKMPLSVVQVAAPARG
jgi:AcrR family transcriptional regulator